MSEEKLVWYRRQPLGNHQFYGPTSEWNEGFKNILYKAKADMIKRYVDTFTEMDSAVIQLDERATLVVAYNLIDFIFTPEIHDAVYDQYDFRFADEDIDGEFKDKIKLVWLGSAVDVEIINDHSPKTHNS